MKYVNYDIKYCDISKDKDLKKFQQNFENINLKKLTKNVGQKKADHLMNQAHFFCMSIKVILCLSLILIISSSKIAKQCQS